MPRSKMTERELAFCEVYARTRNAENSAIEAGYTPTNARKNAWQILNRPHVQEHMNVLAERATGMVAVSLADVIDSLAAIAFANPVNYFKWTANGRLVGKSPEELSKREHSAVKRIRVLKCGEYEYDLHDKMKALTALGKHLGMFEGKSSSRIESNPFEEVAQDKLDEIATLIDEAVSETESQDVRRIPRDSSRLNQ